MSSIFALLLLSAPSNAIDSSRVDWHLPANLAVVSAKATSNVSFDRAVAEWTSPPRAGSQSVRLRLAGRLDTIYAFVKLAELREVLVAARPLKRGEIVTSGDVRKELRPSEGLDLSLIGARMQANLQSGDVILASHVELPPPLARGTPVKVVVASGAIRVKAAGRLHESCRLGERCRASIDNQKPLAGRLIDKTTFLLESP